MHYAIQDVIDEQQAQQSEALLGIGLVLGTIVAGLLLGAAIVAVLARRHKKQAQHEFDAMVREEHTWKEQKNHYAERIVRQWWLVLEDHTWNLVKRTCSCGEVFIDRQIDTFIKHLFDGFIVGVFDVLERPLQRARNH